MGLSTGGRAVSSNPEAVGCFFAYQRYGKLITLRCIGQPIRRLLVPASAGVNVICAAAGTLMARLDAGVDAMRLTCHTPQFALLYCRSYLRL